LIDRGVKEGEKEEMEYGEIEERSKGSLKRKDWKKHKKIKV
jgi:hypothetical protein